MTGKEKLDLALAHKDGPVLLDIGGTPVTGIHSSMVERLRDYYGLEKRPVTIIEPLQMLGLVEDDLKEALGVQTTPLWSNYNIFGFQDKNFKEFKTHWGQTVLVSDDFVTSRDEKGNTFIYPCGDKNCSPCACMPGRSYYFDSINRSPKFDEDNYNIEDNMEEFQPISDESLAHFKSEADRLAGNDNAVVGSLGGTAIGDIALVPGTMLKEPKGIREIEEWYVSIILRQDELHKIFTYQTKMALQNLEKIYKVIGNTIQVTYVCGTDFGTQNGQFCSNEVFRELYMPYYKKINGWIHENTKWKTFKHCCGSIKPLIPELIDSGFDILNPVQWTAANMNKEDLKTEFGKHIVFWGGGVDTQKTLPFGSPKEVHDQVIECCKVFSKNGGFVFNTVHNIQPLIPIENIVAMINAIKEFNGER